GSLRIRVLSPQSPPHTAGSAARRSIGKDLSAGGKGKAWARPRAEASGDSHRAVRRTQAPAPGRAPPPNGTAIRQGADRRTWAGPPPADRRPHPASPKLTVTVIERFVAHKRPSPVGHHPRTEPRSDRERIVAHERAPHRPTAGRIPPAEANRD